MAKKWRIESSNIMIEEYIIEADNEAEARDIWANTNCPSPVAVEHQEEKIENIERIKNGIYRKIINNK